MPYKIRKVNGKECWKVSSPTRVHAKCTTFAKAKKQMGLLKGWEASGKRSPKKSPKTKSHKSTKKTVKIKKSTRPEKKYMAIFSIGDNVKTVHFGQSGASDFTKHKDTERKQRYIDRHSKNENWNNPMTAGALSRYILWNKTTLKDSIADYKRRFHLG
jgi:hypothetical protein